MKFIELKASLKNNIFPAYLLSGEDSFLIFNSKNMIIDTINVELPEMNYIELSNENFKVSDLISACETLPFMGEKKIICLNIYSKMSVSDLNEIGRYLASPCQSTCLIIEDTLSQINTSALKNIENVDCTRLDRRMLSKWIANTLSKKYSKQIEVSAINKLCDYSNSFLSKIDNDLAKLAGFVGNREIINADDVEQIVSKDFEYRIYELSDSIGKKDLVKIYEILNALKIEKNNSGVVISTLYSYFRRMFYALISTGMSNYDLSKFLGIKEYAVTKSKETARLYTPNQLKRAMEMCAESEFNFKNGTISKDFANENLVISLCNL